MGEKTSRRYGHKGFMKGGGRVMREIGIVGDISVIEDGGSW